MGGDQLFSGVIAPVLTPFDADLEPDPARFVEHAAWLLEDGCTGLAPFGTTGEALSLGLRERRRLLDALLEGGIDPALLMPGTGLCSIPDTVELCRHAVETGCGGVMVLPPFYFKGPSDDGVFEHFREVVERVGDDRLRVYLYHIPPQAAVGFAVELVGRLVEAFPGVVVGLKDSSGEWSYTEALLAAYPGFRVLSGSETFLLDNLRHGGGGCITATGNVNARRIRAVWDAFEAEALQAGIAAMRKCIQSRPMIPALKHLVAGYRGDPQWEAVRPPFQALPAAVGRELRSQLERLHGFAPGFPRADAPAPARAGAGRRRPSRAEGADRTAAPRVQPGGPASGPGLEILPIDDSFAHEVTGLDPWRGLSAADADALREAWTRHGVLVLRRQALSEEELVAFGRHFGEPEVIVRTDWQSAVRPEVIHISNLRGARGESIGGLGSGELDWHTDQSYVADPATGSMLYMVEQPPAGGRTYWANLALAWEALPAAERRRVEGLHVVYDYLRRQSTYDDEAPMPDELRRKTPPVAHPLVNVHPVTGRKALYLDPTTAAGVEGWPADESAALLEALRRHATRPEFVYAHEWRVGDVVMWDNGFLMHRRDEIDPAAHRWLKRTTLRLPPERHIVPPSRRLAA